ncbi:MAG: hypothetical protein AB7N91_19515 [Candidatus Tectimicrobiota bacterium]
MLGPAPDESPEPQAGALAPERFPPAEVTRVQAVLECTGLAAQAQPLAKNLPHGHQRTLGMALAARPTLLMRGEPVTGMNLDQCAGRVAHPGRTKRHAGADHCQPQSCAGDRADRDARRRQELLQDAGVNKAYLGT